MWSYSNIDPQRETKMRRWFSVVELAQELRDCEILVCELNAGNDPQGTYYRIEYCVDVGCDLFDKFFNSEAGYRGAYFRSPGEGIGFNSNLLNALSDWLLAHRDIHTKVEEREWQPWVKLMGRTSLLSPSAKVWLCEAAKETDISRRFGEWSELKAKELGEGKLARIHNLRWKCRNDLDWQDGTLAPCLTKLHICGGLISSEGAEWVSPRKVLRAHQIHATGNT